MTQLSQTNFDYSTILNNKSLNLSFNRYVPNAIEKIVPSKEGKPLMNILVSEFMGTTSLDLKMKSFRYKTYLFGFNKKLESPTKPTVYFEKCTKQFLISSNIELSTYSSDLKKIHTIPAKYKTYLDKIQFIK